MEIVDNQNRNSKRYSIQDLEDFAVKFYQTSPTGYTQSSKETNEKFEVLNKKIDRITFCLFGTEGDEDAGLITLVKQIKEQTLKTNGRVNAIEKKEGSVVGVIALLCFIVPACVGWAFYKINTLNDTLIAHVSSDTKEFNKLK